MPLNDTILKFPYKPLSSLPTFMSKSASASLSAESIGLVVLADILHGVASFSFLDVRTSGKTYYGTI